MRILIFGAGGGFDGDVLDAALTPRLIQPTTIGRVGGREKALASLFRTARIPCQIVADMGVAQDAGDPGACAGLDAADLPGRGAGGGGDRPSDTVTNIGGKEP